MKPQQIYVVFAVLALLALTAASAFAAESYNGTISSVGDDSLVLTSEVAEHTFSVGDDVTITLDGAEAELSDLKAGHSATVTADESDDGLVATSIEAKSATEAESA